MTKQALYNMLSTAFPTCHNDWSGHKTVPEPPYVAYLDNSTSSFGADNKVYNKADNYIVELYICKGDTESEDKLDQLFDDNEIYYNKAKIWIKDIKLFQVNYQI